MEFLWRAENWCFESLSIFFLDLSRSLCSETGGGKSTSAILTLLPFSLTSYKHTVRCLTPALKTSVSLSFRAQARFLPTRKQSEEAAFEMSKNQSWVLRILEKLTSGIDSSNSIHFLIEAKRFQLFGHWTMPLGWLQTEWKDAELKKFKKEISGWGGFQLVLSNGWDKHLFTGHLTCTVTCTSEAHDRKFYFEYTPF